MQPKCFTHPVPEICKSEKQINSLLRCKLVLNGNFYNDFNSRTNKISLDFATMQCEKDNLIKNMVKLP